MTAEPPDADAYWKALIRSYGVGASRTPVLGGVMSRTFVRHFESIHSSGVLESLVGASRILDLAIYGRIQKRGRNPDWVLMDISPVYNSWHVEYGSGFCEANLGRDGQIVGHERSAVPMPRAHFQHPSNLVFYDNLPIWGGRGHTAEDYLPGRVEVLWHETAPATTGQPGWRMDKLPGALARIELVCPASPDAGGTAIFQLSRRLCLYYELRYQGASDFRMLVDAVKADPQAEWDPLTEEGDTMVAASPRGG